MSEPIPVIDNPNVSANLADEIATWGDLERINRYNQAHVAAYYDLIGTAREYIGQSLLAAALVSAEDAQEAGTPPHYGKKVLQAMDTTKDVNDMQDFVSENPEDVGLHLGEFHVIVFKLAELEMATFYHKQSGRHAYVHLKAPLQTGLTLHGGQLSAQTSISDRSDKGWREGFQVFNVTFNDIYAGVVPTILHAEVPPLTFGRQAVTVYFDKQAFVESTLGGTTQRRSSLPYGIWRVRNEDAMLTRLIDKTAANYGLVDLWTGQYRREIGAKAAHKVLASMVGSNVPQAGIKYELPEFRVSSFFNEEPTIYGTDPNLYLTQARTQARRLGFIANDTTLRGAIEAVFNT